MKDTLIIATTGTHSDYGVIALVKWLSDQSPEEARKTYLEEHHNQAEDYELDESEIVPWLIQKGFCEELALKELHLASYSCIDKEWTFKQPRSVD